MNFENLAPLEKFEYIITNYDKVIDSEAYKAAKAFGYTYTKEEFKSTMHYCILKRINNFKQLNGLGVVVGINCKQAVQIHIHENSIAKINYGLHLKKHKYEKEHNCSLESKEEICKALGIKPSTYERHFNLSFSSIDAKIDRNDNSERANSMDTIIPDNSISVEDEVINKIIDENLELQITLNRCINSLSDIESLAIKLRYFNNYSYEKIAVVMGMSIKSVDNAIDRAKNSLRGMLLSRKNFEIVRKFI